MSDHDPAVAARVRRTPWEERLAHVMATRAPADVEAWTDALAGDHEIMGRVYRSLLQVLAAPSRRGERSAPEPDRDTMAQLRRLMGEDYTCLAFAEAVSMLAVDRGLSLSALTAELAARGTPISRSQVHRLMRGDAYPMAGEVSALAGVFDKHPEFFAEYRLALVLAMTETHLRSVPDASVVILRQMRESLRQRREAERVTAPSR